MTLNFDFDLRFLNSPNWEFLHKLSAERLAQEPNPVIRALWRGIELEADCRNRKSDQHAQIVIELPGIPAEDVTRAVVILSELSSACAAKAHFRATAFFVEFIQEITRVFCGVTDEQKTMPN